MLITASWGGGPTLHCQTGILIDADTQYCIIAPSKTKKSCLLWHDKEEVENLESFTVFSLLQPLMSQGHPTNISLARANPRTLLISKDARKYMEVNELLGEVYCCYHKQEPFKSQLCLTSQLLRAQ